MHTYNRLSLWNEIEMFKRLRVISDIKKLQILPLLILSVAKLIEIRYPLCREREGDE
jgi:hypothetical protein